jgi:hypothetical protein
MNDKISSPIVDITNALKKTKELLPEHYSSLFGERTAGSKWGFELDPRHLGSNWKLVQGGPVRIYERISGHEFSLGIRPLKIVNHVDIQIKDGDHGPELVMDVSEYPDIDYTVTNIMTLIIGPEEDCGDVVFTIHPGQATPPHGCKTAEELQEKLDKGELNPDTSIKFV